MSAVSLATFSVIEGTRINEIVAEWCFKWFRCFKCMPKFSNDLSKCVKSWFLYLDMWAKKKLLHDSISNMIPYCQIWQGQVNGVLNFQGDSNVLENYIILTRLNKTCIAFRIICILRYYLSQKIKQHSVFEVKGPNNSTAAGSPQIAVQEYAQATIKPLI